MCIVSRFMDAVVPGLALMGLLTLGAVSGSACSGVSSSNRPLSNTPSPDSKEARQQRALDKLRMRQETACERVAPVITGCAVEDARSSLPAEELAKLDLDNTVRLHQAEVVKACTSADMSPRQVKVYEDCLIGDIACSVFLDCLDQAKPQK